MDYSTAVMAATQVAHVALCLVTTVLVMGGIGFGGAWVVEKRFDPSRY